jgi:hypothetical protein
MSHFQSGQVVATQGVVEILGNEHHQFLVTRCLGMHLSCNWVNDCKEDIQANYNAIEHGGRVVTSWEVGKHKLFIITDGIKPIGKAGDHTYTTVMLRSEY